MTKTYGPERILKYCFAAILFASAGTNAFADSWATFESPLVLDVSRWKMYSIMTKLEGNSFGYEPESLGFAYSYYNLRTGAFNYQVYGGTISEKQKTVIIRIEGDTGDVRTLSRVFYLEGLTKMELPELDSDGNPMKYAPLTRKYHVIGQGLNWVAPWLAVLHSSYNSPRLSDGQTLFRFSMYFGADTLLLWASGRNWFRNKFDPVKYSGNVAAALFIPRLIGSIQSANLVRGHNRLVELKYTFPVN